jgi:hypothetical protein
MFKKYWSRDTYMHYTCTHTVNVIALHCNTTRRPIFTVWTSIKRDRVPHAVGDIMYIYDFANTSLVIGFDHLLHGMNGDILLYPLMAHTFDYAKSRLSLYIDSSTLLGSLSLWTPMHSLQTLQCHLCKCRSALEFRVYGDSIYSKGTCRSC